MRCTALAEVQLSDPRIVEQAAGRSLETGLAEVEHAADIGMLEALARVLLDDDQGLAGVA
jgi:hypothetical protein